MAISAAVFHALDEVDKTLSGGSGFFDEKAFSIVVDNDGKLLSGDSDGELNGGGLGVFDSVVEGFAGGEEDVVSAAGADGPVGDVSFDVGAEGYLRIVEKFASEGGQVVDEGTEAVFFWGGGPDDFIQGCDDVFGLVGEGMEGGTEIGVVRVFGSEGGKEGEFCEACSEVVVEVGGDAGAFVFQGVVEV